MSRRPTINTNDVAEKKTHEINLATNKEIDRPDLDDIAVVTGDAVDSPAISEHLQILSFMEEPVTFEVAKTGAEFELDPVDVSVNGEKILIHRGKKVTHKRKFLNALIGTVSKVDTEQYTDSQGVNQTKIVKDTSPSLPISIWHDPSGDYGAKWFQYTQIHGG